MIVLRAPEGNAHSISIIRSKETPSKHSRMSRNNSKALLKNKGWRGKWSGREELKYIQFLEHHKSIMESPQ